MKGKYIVIESIDGGGKGIILKGFKKYHEEKKEFLFDIEDQWKNRDSSFIKWFGTNDVLPSYEFVKQKLLEEGKNPSGYIVAEPTFEGMGKFIREVAINNKKFKEYTPQMRINLYAQNRYSLLKKFILPALEDGKHVYSSRNITSSLVYQTTELNCSFEQITKIEGNNFALKNLPDHTIISAISINKSLSNLSNRDKQDDAFFENKEFQTMILKKYLSQELKDYLEKNNSEVIYFNISEESGPEDTIKRSKELIKKIIIKKKKIIF